MGLTLVNVTPVTPFWETHPLLYRVHRGEEEGNRFAEIRKVCSKKASQASHLLTVKPRNRYSTRVFFSHKV